MRLWMINYGIIFLELELVFSSRPCFWKREQGRYTDALSSAIGKFSDTICRKTSTLSTKLCKLCVQLVNLSTGMLSYYIFVQFVV